MKALLRDWPAVVGHLQEEAEGKKSGATAKGFLKVITIVRFVSLLPFLADLFAQLSRLSKAFQNNDLVVSDLPSLIQSTRKKLVMLRGGPRKGGYMEQFNAKYDEKTFTFNGVRLTQKHAGRCASDSATLLEATINHIEQRFASVIDNPVIAACSIFNPLTWPADVHEFGADSISILTLKLSRRISDVQPTSKMLTIPLRSNYKMSGKTSSTLSALPVVNLGPLRKSTTNFPLAKLASPP